MTTPKVGVLTIRGELLEQLDEVSKSLGWLQRHHALRVVLELAQDHPDLLRATLLKPTSLKDRP